MSNVSQGQTGLLERCGGMERSTDSRAHVVQFEIPPIKASGRMQLATALNGSEHWTSAVLETVGCADRMIGQLTALFNRCVQV